MFLGRLRLLGRSTCDMWLFQHLINWITVYRRALCGLRVRRRPQAGTDPHRNGRVRERERSSRASKVQLLTLVHSALERAPLPLGVERPLKRLHAARQLVEARVVDDQDAVEVVELVLEGLGLGLGLGLLG